jgi:hypothetical protein
MEYDDILKILLANKDKSFVDRIINKDNYPVLTEDGETTKNIPKYKTYHTHLMSYVETDGKWDVFPTVLYDGNGQLTKYEPMEAYKHVRKSGNYISFDKEEDAENFTNNYKKVWEPPETKKKIIRGN